MMAVDGVMVAAVTPESAVVVVGPLASKEEQLLEKSLACFIFSILFEKE